MKPSVLNFLAATLLFYAGLTPAFAADTVLQVGSPNATEPTVYHVDQWVLDGNVEVIGPVVVVVDGLFDVHGQNLTVKSTGSLQLYIGGEAKAPGSSILYNEGLPEKMAIYGTATEGTQKFTLSGGGQMSAVIYAPNAFLRISGGDLYGAAVVQSMEMSGGVGFHVDETLFEEPVAAEGTSLGVTLTQFDIQSTENTQVPIGGQYVDLVDLIEAQF